MSLADAAPQEEFVGDHQDGSRSPAVHVIDLIDPEGDRIFPGAQMSMPFSTKNTCGECHDYEMIAGGWHFNFNQPDIPSGRKAQPWIWVDHETATQIPVSYRSWPGVYHPEQLGITPWQFAVKFGRHLPGNLSEKDEGQEPDFDARWLESGPLEINCLACHNVAPDHDQSEYATQVVKENFRWAAAASAGFVTVEGAARDMEDMWDYLMGDRPEDPKLIPPTVHYDKDVFDHNGQVFFDVSREIPDARCYFCHSNFDMTGLGKWVHDEDVHLEAGLRCVDCHRNGNDHMIIRGYEGEQHYSDNPLAAASSCEACHLEDHHAEHPVAGRFAAPHPHHPGLPPIHFEKLTCTACHSGPYPQEVALETRTARAHALGAHDIIKTDDMLPHIYSPVYMRNPEGKIGPHKIFWPAFWGVMQGEHVTPLTLESARSAVARLVGYKRDTLNWPQVTEEKVTQALAALKSEVAEGKPVYIAGGKLYTLDEAGKLTEQDHAAAAPASWPIAHDVRPAAQSLGEAKHCQFCHANDSPFFAGQVPIDTPIVSRQGATMQMASFLDLDMAYFNTFNSTFGMRPVLKTVGLALSAVIGLILLLYVLKALDAVLKTLAQNRSSH